MSFVTTRYGEVFYSTMGKGTPLVLIHGNTMTAASQERLAKYFTDEHEVISIDLLGHGHSARPEGLFTSNYFMMQGQALEDVLAALFPKTSVAVFGMSAGAVAILNAMCEDASHISALILDSVFHVIGAETVAAHYTHVHRVSSTWDRYMRTQHGDDWWPLLLTGILAAIEQLAAQKTSVIPCLEHINRPIIDRPILMFQGGRDQFCPESQARMIASSVPNARLIYDSHAGHILAWKNPAAFREIVREFLHTIRYIYEFRY